MTIEIKGVCVYNDLPHCPICNKGRITKMEWVSMHTDSPLYQFVEFGPCRHIFRRYMDFNDLKEKDWSEWEQGTR